MASAGSFGDGRCCHPSVSLSFARREISWNPQRIPDTPSDFMEDSIEPLVY
jgi:hypothetical protein